MKKMDWLIPGAALLVALFWYIGLLFSMEKGAYAEVYVDGKLFGRYPLAENAEISIPNNNNSGNILIILDGAADMVSAGCPDRLCVRQASIERSGEVIVCLPNRLVVEITGGVEEGMDAISE